MKLSVFFTIVAIVGLLFGLAFLLAPVQTMSVYGVDLDVSGHYIARYFGAALIGYALILWQTKAGDPQDKTMRGILLGALIMTAASAVAALFDALYGVGNSLVWSTFAIYLLFTIGFGSFNFKK